MLFKAGSLLVILISLSVMGTARQNAAIGNVGVHHSNDLVKKSVESRVVVLRQETSETLTITHTATTSSTPTGSVTVTASLTAANSETATASPTITATVTTTYTLTPTASPTMATNTLTSILPTFPQPPATQTPLWTETGSPTPESLSSIVPATATFAPLPVVTFQFPQLTKTVGLLMAEHPPDSPDLTKGGRVLEWKKLLRWWPLLIILGLWLILGFWFVLSQGYLERD